MAESLQTQTQNSQNQGQFRGRKYFNNKYTRVQCTFCKKPGHQVEDCFVNPKSESYVGAEKAEEIRKADAERAQRYLKLQQERKNNAKGKVDGSKALEYTENRGRRNGKQVRNSRSRERGGTSADGRKPGTEQPKQPRSRKNKFQNREEGMFLIWGTNHEEYAAKMREQLKNDAAALKKFNQEFAQDLRDFKRERARSASKNQAPTPACHNCKDTNCCMTLLKQEHHAISIPVVDIKTKNTRKKTSYYVQHVYIEPVSKEQFTHRFGTVNIQVDQDEAQDVRYRHMPCVSKLTEDQRRVLIKTMGKCVYEETTPIDMIFGNGFHYLYQKVEDQEETTYFTTPEDFNGENEPGNEIKKMTVVQGGNSYDLYHVKKDSKITIKELVGYKPIHVESENDSSDDE